MQSLVTLEELKNVTGYGRVGDVEGWLQREGIPFFRGKKGHIFTTIDKLNEALTVVEYQSNAIEFGYGKTS